MAKHINMVDFKTMFANFCHNEIEAGNCEPDGCQWCCINQAWDKIFWIEREDFLKEYDDESTH